MELDRVIKERFSVRKFRAEKLTDGDISAILTAGHLAPTGCNNQPQRILVIRSDEAMSKLRECTRCHFGAPNAMLVCHDESESWVRPYDGAKSSAVDAVIVATHMMLKAHEIGVGCCWVMHFNPEKLRKAFSIPDCVQPTALLMLGYPAPDAKPLDLHEKTRPLGEVVVYDSFDKAD